VIRGAPAELVRHRQLSPGWSAIPQPEEWNTMRAGVLTSLAGGLLGVLSVGALLWRPAPASVAMQPPAPEESRTIPLESCYATFGGSGCMYLMDSPREPQGPDLAAIYRDHKGGASNVVLVRGNDITAAVKAARWAFTTIQWADTPGLPDLQAQDAKRDPLWLVAYLGTSGNTSARWRVHSAETRGLVVRLTYSRIRSTGPSNPVLRHYYVWVPLGQVQAGTYTLELNDTDRKEVMLLRRVAVAQP
jgi:hypothetical protein